MRSLNLPEEQWKGFAGFRKSFGSCVGVSFPGGHGGEGEPVLRLLGLAGVCRAGPGDGSGGSREVVPLT